MTCSPLGRLAMALHELTIGGPIRFRFCNRRFLYRVLGLCSYVREATNGEDESNVRSDIVPANLVEPSVDCRSGGACQVSD